MLQPELALALRSGEGWVPALGMVLMCGGARGWIVAFWNIFCGPERLMKIVMVAALLRLGLGPTVPISPSKPNNSARPAISIYAHMYMYSTYSRTTL